MSNADLIERLRNTPNWMRESFGDWKGCVSAYDRAPFEAADALAAADKRIAELERKLNPLRWTKADSDAWHRAIPNLQAAFEALAQIGGE